MTAAAHALGERSTWVEPQPALMLRPSGESAIAVDLARQPPEDLGRHLVGRTVGAVEQDVDAAQGELGEARVQLAQVVLGGARAAVRTRPIARRAASTSPLESRLDRHARLVGELVAVGGEKFDAVVLVGVVRCRDARPPGRSRSGRSAAARRASAAPAEQDVAAGGAEARGERRLEHVAGLARVADDSTRGRSPPVWRGRRVPSASASSAVSNSPATPRTPSVPNSLRTHARPSTGAQPSACRTAAACAPSSGRPSCAPWRASRASGSRGA